MPSKSRREEQRTWRAANPEKCREYRRRRAEKERGDPITRCLRKESGARYRAKNRKAILARQKAYRDSQRGKKYHARYTAAYYADPTRRMQLLLGGAAKRASRFGAPLDPELRATLLASPPTHCACCGEVLDYSMGKGRNQRDRSPSIDRLDNAQGYTLTNVRMTCMRCNDVKGHATLAELETVVAYVKREAGLAASRLASNAAA